MSNEQLSFVMTFVGFILLIVIFALMGAPVWAVFRQILAIKVTIFGFTLVAFMAMWLVLYVTLEIDNP